MKKILVFILCLLPGMASAKEVLTADPILKRLFNDFRADIQSFDQFNDAGSLRPEVKKYLVDWNQWVSTGAKGAAPALVLPNKTWNFDLHFLEGATNSNVPHPEIENWKLSRHVANEPSAMKDPFLYIKERIGDEAYALIQEGKVEPVVYGGTIDSWKTSGLVGPDQPLHIPSPYEDWGITKFYIPVISGKPKLVFVIPPLKEYLLHYLAMFEIASGKEHEGNLNLTDRKAFEGYFKKSLAALPPEMKQTLGKAWVVLGYESKIEEKMKVGGKVLFSVKDPVLSLTAYEMADTKQIFVSLGVELTVWGEGTSFLVKEVLPYQPEGVLFLGSAGYLQNDEKSYADYSPLKFYNDKLKPLKISTSIQDAKGAHFSTYSPLAETKTQVAEWIKNGITSVDVEEARVAKVIDEFNQTAVKPVKFGATNLITDFPQGMGKTHRVSYDLNTIDEAAKEAARDDIVNKSLQFLKLGSDYCKNLMNGLKK